MMAMSLVRKNLLSKKWLSYTENNGSTKNDFFLQNIKFIFKKYDLTNLIKTVLFFVYKLLSIIHMIVLQSKYNR